MATRKKLLFVITKSNWGGAQRYVYDLATHLNTEYDVAVAAGGSGILFERLQEKGIRTISLTALARDIEAKSDFAAFRELIRVFRDEKPDIVHLNSSKAGILGALAGRIARIPRLVFTVHGWPFNEPVSSLSRAFRWIASCATLLLCHSRIIAVSHFDAMHAPLGLRMVTIHNGIEELAFLSREEAQKKLSLTDETHFVIGTIAELHKNKGIDILVEALPHVSNAVLVVIGEGEERKVLEEMIIRLKLETRAHLIGFMENAARVLPAFDLFVLPSRTEALGYVLLEAGFAGVPVAASTVGGIPEVIDDGLNGVLFPAYDSEALAKAVNELIASPNVRAHYAERLKEKVARYFALRGMVKKTIEVYET
jgi:glycosyltransferase involved in cell wall biosynthesis